MQNPAPVDWYILSSNRIEVAFNHHFDFSVARSDITRSVFVRFENFCLKSLW